MSLFVMHILKFFSILFYRRMDIEGENEEEDLEQQQPEPQEQQQHEPQEQQQQPEPQEQQQQPEPQEEFPEPQLPEEDEEGSVSLPATPSLSEIATGSTVSTVVENLKNKTTWTSLEDHELIIQTKKHRGTNKNIKWEEVSKRLEKYSIGQCKNRYKYLKNKNKSKKIINIFR